MTAAQAIKFLREAPGRIRVVLTNLLTLLLAATAGLTWLIASGTLEVFGPEVLEYATVALAVIGAAVTFIRRVTPVAPDDRGLL